MIASFRVALLAGAALLPCGTAQAADVTPEQAKAAEAAVRDWLGGMLGTSVKAPERPVQLTPAGDHFDVSVPVSLPGTAGAPIATVTAQARPLDGGKWAVDGIRTSMPLHFTANVPVPPENGDKKAPPVLAPVTYTVDIKGQDGHGVIDPALSGPSNWTMTSTGATIKTEGGPLPYDAQVGPYNSSVTVQPAGPGRLDLTTAATMQDYHMVSSQGAMTPLDATIKLVRLGLGVTGLNRDHAQALVQGMVGVFASMGPGSAAAAPAKVGPEVVTAMLAALQDVASEMSLDEQAEGVAVTVSGIPVTIGKVQFGMTGKSADGLLEARMPVELQGLGTGAALPPDMIALIPSEVAIRPVLSGVGVAELFRIAQAMNEKHDPAPADVKALFSHGGVKLGVESMTLAMAGATFEGTGAIVYSSPQDGTGTARITATGYDEMMHKISAIPAISRQAVPALAFVKGISKTVDGKLVWDLTYKNGKALVNDVDLSSLSGGPAAGPSNETPAPAPSAPGPNPRPRTPAAPQSRPPAR